MDAEDIRACIRYRRSDPALSGPARGLIDTTDARLELDYETIAGLAGELAGRGSSEPWAIVAPGDLGYGIGRVLAARTEATRPVGVFRTRGEAERWLDHWPSVADAASGGGTEAL